MAEQKKDKMSEGIKSEINKQRKDQGQKGIGEYTEAPGGGTPASGGGRGAMKGQFEVVNSKEEADAIREKNPNAKIRYNQPRNEDGQFTYNSANGKGLSTETSRGHTKPPFLTGVDLTFIKKGSTFQFQEGENFKRIISTIDLSAEELVNSCKVYFETEGGFLGVIGTAITKKGSKSKIEKTGAVGKTGEIDLSTKSQTTQKEAEEAASKKDVAGLEAQKKASEEAVSKKFAKHLKKQPSQTVQSVKTTQPVGVGASNNIAPKPTPQQEQQKPVNTSKIFVKKNNIPTSTNQTDVNDIFEENVKQEIKANPQQWVQKNK